MLLPEAAAEEGLGDVHAALGTAPVDMRLENCRIASVYSEEVHQAAIAIRGGRIVAIRPHQDGPADTVLDLGGALVMPGFVRPLGAGGTTAPGTTSAMLPAGGAAEGSARPFFPAAQGEGSGFRDHGASGRHRALHGAAACTSVQAVAAGLRQGKAAIVSAEAPDIAAFLADPASETRHLLLVPPQAPLLAELLAAVPAGRLAQLLAFNAALHYGVDHEIGGLAPGRAADLVVIDADRRITRVMAGGRFLNGAMP